MDLITTHKSADFDALSSLVAASKLYPKARLLLPGSQEKSVRKFLSLIKDKIRIEGEKTCRLDDVTRLVIVDNRHASRIGIAGDLLGKKGLKVHIYDHHPRTRRDIKADKDVFKEVGATVSLLLEILAKKGKLDLTPLEATLMLLGIYEETGSLSYSTTTKLDVEMVGTLLEMGANLSAVSSYLNRELSGVELTALIALLESTEVVDVNGIDVAFSTVDASSFDGEMGTVVHKLQDVENYPVLFAMMRTGNRIKILARSRVRAIDMNKLLKHFKGAGHASAASARVEDRTFEELKAEILHFLGKRTKPEVRAEDIMSYPVKTVSQEEKVSDVLKKFGRLGCKGAPVLDEAGQLVGIVSTGDLKKAIKHEMGHSRVKGYMATSLITALPDTPLYELQRLMLDKGKGRIPIIRKNKIVGIVTRTDVLKKVHSSLFSGEPKKMKESNLSSRMTAVLPKKLLGLIRSIGREADKLGVSVFLVGGFVRDILLERKNYDLDVVVEGDAIKFGKLLADKMKGALVVHKKFGTSTVVKDWPKWLGPSLHPDNKFKIDVAMARKEVYERPAALPTVRFSSLKEDLYRRDFTINAMAVCINRRNFGLFIDFFGGMKDLEKRAIRILHDRSFIDDPTRIFRAVRFEQRFGFVIDKHTEYLIKHAVKQEMFRRTENQRIRDELILILKEKYPEKAVFRMRQLHELRFIHPELVLKRPIRSNFDELRKCVRWYGSASGIKKRQLDAWLMNLMVILDKLTLKQLEEVLEKFVFTKSESIRLRSYKERGDKVIKRLSSRKRIAPSEVYRLLEPFSHEVALFLMAKTASATARRRIKKFFTDYNGIKLKIRGHDIEKEGITPGPRYKELLKKVLYKKLDGKIPAKKDELGYMRQLIGKTGKGLKKRKKR